MRRVPQDVHREVLKRDEREFGPGEPVLYAVWLGPPHGEKSELLGRTERTLRPRWWRAFPVTGEWPKEMRGWTAVTEWLLAIRRQHQDLTQDNPERQEQEGGVPIAGTDP